MNKNTTKYLVSQLTWRDSNNVDSDEYWKSLKVFNTYEEAHKYVQQMPKDEEYDIAEIVDPQQ